MLNGISLIGRYSYIVEVSAAHPYKAGETLKAAAYIYQLKPAIVKLNSLETYFLPTIRILQYWLVLRTFDTINGSEFEFEVTDNLMAR